MAARSAILTTTQVGVESTWGTSVDQTAKLTHLNSFIVQPEVVVSRYGNVGDLATGTQHDVTRVHGSGTMEGRANYGTLPLWLNNLFGDATTAGAGPYTHTHDVDSTSAPTRAGYTLCKSDGTDAVSLAGGLITEYRITATPGELVQETINWIGKQVEDDALTAGQSAFTDIDQLLKPSEATVYLDPVGSAGTTALDCDALSLELAITADTRIQHGLGTIAACDVLTYMYDVRASISGEAGNATIKTYIENLLGASPTATALDLQVTFTKSANYAWTVIIPVVLESAPAWHTDSDGILTFDLSFVGVKSSSSSAGNSFFDSVVTNQDAVI